MKYKINTSEQFDKWFGKLKDIKAKARITLRLRQVSTGHFGDHKLVSNNLYELRFFFGSGYRVYYTIQNNQIVILLSGGDKVSQSKDIAKAKKLLLELES